MYELKERNWGAFFREPVTSQLFSAPEEKQSPTRGHVMRMPSREMCEYGILPETDPFIVVVCGVCKGAVKPQGLRKHIHRHNTGDSASLANLITPCSVSVSALKYDPKADNSNSSTSSVYNMTAGGVNAETTSSSSSGDASSVLPAASFQDFSALSATGIAAASPPATLLSASVAGTTALASHKSSCSSASSSSSNSAISSTSLGKGNGGGGKPTASLKLKLIKTTGLKTGSSSSSSRSVSSESPSSFLACTADTATKCSLRPSNNPEASRSSSPPTPTTASEAYAVPSSSSSSGGGKKLSLKEREYDANKHCGVILVDTGKHCTRTLTCKSHALSLRRQVAGRSMSFDQLLSDHRAMRALLASGKAPPLSNPLPPPQTALHALPTGHEGTHHSNSSSKKRELSEVPQQPRHRRSSHSPEQPPAKKLQMERSVSGGGGSYRKSHSHSHHHHHSSIHIKSEPADEEPQTLLLDESFRGPGSGTLPGDIVPPVARPRFEAKPAFHENGLALHDGAQLVASSNGGYFLKSEPQMGPSPDLMTMRSDVGEGKIKEPTIITVPLTMLANVMYVNGRNCILEPPSQLSGGADEENENRPGSEKGRHVEVVDGGERRRYLTLSSGRQQRATNRLRLNVIRTEETGAATSVEQKNGGESEVVSAQEYPGIDTWFHQIPKPTYVNCFKLCKLGSSAVLSKRYLNIRRSLIMNMTANQGLVGSPAAVAALNRSNSQTGSSPVGGGVDKGNNFHAERIKV